MTVYDSLTEQKCITLYSSWIHYGKHMQDLEIHSTVFLFSLFLLTQPTNYHTPPPYLPFTRKMQAPRNNTVPGEHKKCDSELFQSFSIYALISTFSVVKEALSVWILKSFLITKFWF